MPSRTAVWHTHNVAPKVELLLMGLMLTIGSIGAFCGYFLF